MPSRCSGAKLRALMDTRRLTSAQLADKSGVSSSTISRILNDRAPNTNTFTIHSLCDALGCEPFDLLSDQAAIEAVRTDVEHAVAEVISEAVTEAVTVVVEDTAPDVTPEQVANAVPALQVTAPPALDTVSYVEYIKAATDKHVEALMRSRNTWIIVSAILFALLVLLVWYFIWEILHPDQGITRVLWEIYSGTAMPTYMPTPTPHP